MHTCGIQVIHELVSSHASSCPTGHLLNTIQKCSPPILVFHRCCCLSPWLPSHLLSLSLSALLQAFCSLPGLLLPSGAQVSTVLAMLLPFLCRTCRIHFHIHPCLIHPNWVDLSEALYDSNRFARFHLNLICTESLLANWLPAWQIDSRGDDLYRFNRIDNIFNPLCIAHRKSRSMK